MMEPQPLCIGLSLTATWLRGQQPGPGGTQDDPDPDHTHAFYSKLAQMAERAKLDFVFKPDALFVNPAAGGRGPGFVSLDPTLMLASIARETRHIGLVTTISTSFNPPYMVARQMQSLHWISNGRAGWNIVTSIGGAENFGDAPMPTSQERYAKADEFVTVVRKLWASYPHTAYRQVPTAHASETAAGVAIAPIDHVGAHFQVKGPLNTPEHPAGSPPLFQAGASDSGRQFAARVADAIFAAIPDIGAGIELRSDLRRRAVAEGRDPDAVRVLPGLYFFLAPTREEAVALHRQAHAFLTRSRRLAALKSTLGLDLSDWPSDERVTPEMLPDPAQPVRSRTHADLLRRYISNEQPTVAQLLDRPEVVGSAHWVSIGTVDDVIADIIHWRQQGAMDGFIALPGGSEQSMQLFFDELMPRLAERGWFRQEYAGTTLREHLGITPASPKIDKVTVEENGNE